MKLEDYNLEGWDKKSIKNEYQFDGITIKLLALNLLEDPPREGRRNLLAVDKDNSIVWIAPLPSGQKLYGFYDLFLYEDEIFKAWCGSFYCEINPINGQILFEQFVK